MAVTKEVLEAIMQASDWFFEQLSGDLGTYAKHACRRTIDAILPCTKISAERAAARYRNEPTNEDRSIKAAAFERGR